MINKNLEKIVPHNANSYKVSLNSKLGNVGREIYDWLESTNKIKPSHKFNDIIYRWVFGISGTDSINYVLNNIPDDLSDLFLTKVINHLGISMFSVNEIKFEKLGPNKFIDNFYLKRSRFGEIITTKQDDMVGDYEKTLFYSTIWHTDKSFNLSNYKILIYLNDVDKDQGGLVISDPILSPKRIDNKCVLIDKGITIRADEIKGKEVMGCKGTTASFNSHILHRANLPKTGYRYCLHLSFLLPGEKYKHNKYSNNHF
jgi:hypothetical protein